MQGWPVVNNVWPGRQQQIKCLYLDRGILVFEHTLTHTIHVPTMSHTLLPVTQDDWCVLRHSQAFDREGKRRGRGRGGGSIADICPCTSGEQEKNTHMSEIHTFHPKTHFGWVVCVQNVLMWPGEKAPNSAIKLHRQSSSIWKGKLLFFLVLPKKHALSHTRT